MPDDGKAVQRRGIPLDAPVRERRSIDDETADRIADSNYIAGLMAGFRLGLQEDDAALAILIEKRHREIRESRRRASP